MSDSSDVVWENSRHRLVLACAAGGRILSWRVDGRERVKPAAGIDGGLLRVLALPERYPGSSYSTPHDVVARRRNDSGFEVTLRYAWNTPALIAGLLDWSGKRNPSYLDGLLLEKTIRFDVATASLAVSLRFCNTGGRALRLSPWLHNAFEGWVENAFVSFNGRAEPYRWDNLFWTGHRAEPGRDMRLVCADPAGRFFAVLGASPDWLDGMAAYTKADFGNGSTEGAMELRARPVEIPAGAAWEARAFLALTEGPDSWMTWARISPDPLTSGPAPLPPNLDPPALARRLLGEWALPEERKAGLMILSALDKTPFTEAARTTANHAFAPFHSAVKRARASVWLLALDDLKEVRAALEAPAGWSLGPCPGRLKKGSLTNLALRAPLSMDGSSAVSVRLSTPARDWRLAVPADAAVEKPRPYQVRQLSAYLEERFGRERDVFPGGTAAGFRRWQTERKKAIGAWLRISVTRPVPLETRLTERQEGPFCVRDKVLIRVEPDMWMPCFLIRPRTPAPGRRMPGLLFCCGSGPGKADMAPDETERAQDPATWAAWPSPYTLAHQLQAVVLIPDRRGWGEWAEGNHSQRPQRALAAGYSVAALEVWDHLKAVDYLAGRPDVDPSRVISMGSSGGGGMTTWMTALHDRVAGGIVSSAMTTVASAPADYFYAMPPDPLPDISPSHQPLCTAGILSLAAPKPLWIMDGVLDGIPNPHLTAAEKQEALRRFRAVQDEGRTAIRRVYDLLDSPSRCRTTWFEGGHLAGFHFLNIRSWLNDILPA